MVASSVQLNAGKVGLCDLTPHRSFSTTAALRPGCLQFQPLLRTVIWCIARGTRRWMSHMSAKGVLLSVSPFHVRTDVTPQKFNHDLLIKILPGNYIFIFLIFSFVFRTPLLFNIVGFYLKWKLSKSIIGLVCPLYKNNSLSVDLFA